MKVELERQADSTATLRIELGPDQVSKEWDAITNSFAKHARIPGYRPGKAPKRVIEAKFRKEIQDELTQKLVSRSYHEAVERERLRVVSLTNVDDVVFGDDRSMRFRATVVTAPEFELPDYKNLKVEMPDTAVTPAEIDEAVERLREQAADFVDAPERPLQMGDFVVIDFEGSVEGKPVAEIAPDSSRNLQGGKKFWLHLAPENFLPGFCEKLVGKAKGETTLVQVDFPADFPVAALAGRRADYAVTINEVKDRVLPPLDDELAAKIVPGKNLEELRHMMEHNLEHEKEHAAERARESQIVEQLQAAVQFELPPPLLRQETRRALGELVRRNRERGVPDDILKNKEKELVEGAGGLAAHRLKTNFILHRIAEQEKISVTRQEVDERIGEEAQRYNLTPEKMRKELEEHGGLDGLAEEVLLGKTLAFLKANVSVERASGTTAESDATDQK